jgi:hypothetical protein
LNEDATSITEFNVDVVQELARLKLKPDSESGVGEAKARPDRGLADEMCGEPQADSGLERHAGLGRSAASGGCCSYHGWLSEYPGTISTTMVPLALGYGCQVRRRKSTKAKT